jgi:rod shape-determining protein MreD
VVTLLESTTARLATVLLMAAVLQYSVLSTIRVGGVAPDLLLVMAIAAGVVAGDERGAVTGFASGVAMDLIMPGRPFGLSVLTFTLVGFLVGRYQHAASNRSTPAVVLTAGLATVLAVGGYVSLARVLGGVDLLDGRFLIVAVVSAMWSMALVLPVSAVIRWAWRQPLGSSVWSR